MATFITAKVHLTKNTNNSRLAILLLFQKNSYLELKKIVICCENVSNRRTYLMGFRCRDAMTIT